MTAVGRRLLQIVDAFSFLPTAVLTAAVIAVIVVNATTPKETVILPATPSSTTAPPTTPEAHIRRTPATRASS